MNFQKVDESRIIQFYWLGGLIRENDPYLDAPEQPGVEQVYFCEVEGYHPPCRVCTNGD